MIQNHLLQVLCMIAMEPPTSLNPEEIRNRKVDVLKAIYRMKPEEIHRFAVRGQYGPGWVQGKKVAAYRDEHHVDKHSMTETYAAVKFCIDNWRWQGVPFYLRTGKRMQESTSSITIQFRQVPHSTFPVAEADGLSPNSLTIHIQPDMDIRLKITSKRPGLEMDLKPAELVFDYRTGADRTPEAYETLLLDAISGDATLFMRSDQVEEAWDVISSIQEVWTGRDSLDIVNYAAGTWGPETSGALLARDGRVWAVSVPHGSPFIPDDTAV
ncbi:MAG TPA: glucose-6-phosphate dehydrogenase, partial [Sphingobacteriaceae bacterium]